MEHHLHANQAETCLLQAAPMPCIPSSIPYERSCLLQAGLLGRPLPARGTCPATHVATGMGVKTQSFSLWMGSRRECLPNTKQSNCFVWPATWSMLLKRCHPLALSCRFSLFKAKYVSFPVVAFCRLKRSLDLEPCPSAFVDEGAGLSGRNFIFDG